MCQAKEDLWWRRNPRQSVAQWQVTQKEIDCIVRELNPGRPRGRRAFYHWTNDALIAPVLCEETDTRPKHCPPERWMMKTNTHAKQCGIRGWMNSFRSIGRSLLFILFGQNLMFEPRVQRWRRHPVPDTPQSLKSLMVLQLEFCSWYFTHLKGQVGAEKLLPWFPLLTPSCRLLCARTGTSCGKLRKGDAKEKQFSAHLLKALYLAKFLLQGFQVN